MNKDQIAREIVAIVSAAVANAPNQPPATWAAEVRENANVLAAKLATPRPLAGHVEALAGEPTETLQEKARRVWPELVIGARYAYIPDNSIDTLTKIDNDRGAWMDGDAGELPWILDAVRETFRPF